MTLLPEDPEAPEPRRLLWIVVAIDVAIGLAIVAASWWFALRPVRFEDADGACTDATCRVLWEGSTPTCTSRKREPEQLLAARSDPPFLSPLQFGYRCDCVEDLRRCGWVQ